ncbi:tyrosine-type recombinase/integrase [Ktedonobacter racemifer]|uniref:Integrase family protein n=1 Tax=Ktedonobacter racemifer DSM 44963 TaxID=485913 RepID=D6U043_KTERA|nr:tyrosine-type recombinase/integrase [Ktedonobacter racemifer]EFH82183.1 integrase family protein [Ktedonobacter racemifer DSM 44963]
MESTSSAIIQPFPGQDANVWITAYRDEVLASRDPSTIEAYTRVLRKYVTWLAQRPGNYQQFHPQEITRTSIEFFLATLSSSSAKKQAKAALSGFCTWLQEEKQLLDRNPTHGVSVPAQALLAPRELSEDQRYVLANLIEREADLRGKAVFALGYWAGCRVSDVSWLLRDQVHVNGKAGWMTVGHKGGKTRTIDLTNGARRPLHEYLEQGTRKESAYVFTSQRAKKRLSAGEVDGWRWSEDGIHQWWQQVKTLARAAEHELIADITFHDLRHDFAHRARAAGWSLEEVAYYLGHITKAGTPAIQTTIRYVQVSRDQVKKKLKDIKG